jgi:hypothetical protein
MERWLVLGKQRFLDRAHSGPGLYLYWRLEHWLALRMILFQAAFPLTSHIAHYGKINVLPTLYKESPGLSIYTFGLRNLVW